MSAFKHGEFEIEMTTGGEFAAMIHGVRVRKSSMAAMKTYINNLGKSKFAPVQCFGRQWRHDEVQAFTVVGIKKKKASYGENAVFVEADGHEHQSPLVDTPENRERYKALEDYRAETKRIRAEREEQESAMDDQLQRLNWREYQ